MRWRWRPRLTPYRLLTIASVVSFGIPHAIYAERDKPIVPIWLDWIFGVFIILILYFGSICERNCPESIPWLFEKDFGSYITNLFEPDDSRTIWESDERMDDFIFITPYRLLVSAVTLVGGFTKVILSLQGHGAAANTVDWSFGVIATIFLYCLGWFEFSSTNLWSPFFATDCALIFQKALSDYGPMVSAAGVIYLSAKWTFMWSSWIAPIWHKTYEAIGFSADLVDGLGWFPGLVTVVGFSDLGILVGIVATLTLIKLVLRHYSRFHIHTTGGYQALMAVLSKLLFVLAIVDTFCLCIAWISFLRILLEPFVHRPDGTPAFFWVFLGFICGPTYLGMLVVGTLVVGAAPWYLRKFAMMRLDQY